MNVMAKAHKDTRFTISLMSAEGQAQLKVKGNIGYARMFAIYLKQAHKENKAMNPIEMLKADTIARFEKRIVELEALKPTLGHKWMVVCGDEHPMPIDFESANGNFWSNVENATKWASPQFARSNASKVVNGNQQKGVAVLVNDHIEWDIANLNKLIADLK